MDQNNSWSPGFEFVDIEIINHKREEDEDSKGKWNCDKCSLFFLSSDRLIEHRKKHFNIDDPVTCKYCNKTLNDSKEIKPFNSYRKCETCEYRCSYCPKRFLRNSSLINHEKSHVISKKKKQIASKENGVESVTNEETLINNRPKILRVTKKNIAKKQLKYFQGTRKKNNNKSNVRKGRKQVQHNDLFVTKSLIDDNSVTQSSSIPLNISKQKTCQNLKRSAKVKDSVKTTSNTSKTLSSNTPSVESVVNYKPFSCHICSDNFATDNALLEHIKLHGENGAGFKCKHCGDAFDDIYKMQYHLAICPLAEDDIVGSTLKVIPSNSLIGSTSFIDIHKKSKCKPSNQIEINACERTEKQNKNHKAKLLVTRKMKKRQLEISTLNTNFDNTFTNKRCRKNIPKEGNTVPFENFGNVSNATVLTKNENDYIQEDAHSYQDAYNTNLNESPKDFELAQNRAKGHACPFPRCGMKFTREKALLCHMRNHSDDFDDNLKCHKCDIPFDDIQSLRPHINSCKGIKEEKDDDFKVCDLPDNSTSSEKIIPFFKIETPFQCEECGNSYTSQMKLKSHNCGRKITNTINPLSMKFPCRLCGEELRNQASLKTHFKAFHPLNLQFQCPTCLIEYDDLEEVNSHILTHIKPRYECSVCLQKYSSKSDLNNHYTSSHPGTDRSVCMICNKKLSDPSALATHVQSHTGYRPYPCPFCSMSFTLKCTQVVHIRRHTNYRPYKCKYCPKSFFISGDLLKHHRMHTGERPYKCEFCDARFTLKECLNNHIRRHLKIHPFKCSMCPKSFNTETSLKYHMTIHEGNHPYPCPLCSKSYSQVGSLQTHIKKQHIPHNKLDALNVCQICGIVKDNALKMAAHMTTHSTEFSGQIGRNRGNTMSRNKGGRPRKNENYSDLPYKQNANTNELSDEFHNTNKEEINLQKGIAAQSIPDISELKTNRDIITKTNYRLTRNVSHQINNKTSSNLSKVKIISLNSRCLTKKNKRKKKSKKKKEVIKSNSVVAENPNNNTLSEEIPPQTNYSNDDGNYKEENEIFEVVEIKLEPPITGVQEVTVFEPVLKANLRCSICTQTFVAHDDLLDHVSVHI